MSTRLTDKDFNCFEWVEENERLARRAYESWKRDNQDVIEEVLDKYRK